MLAANGIISFFFFFYYGLVVFHCTYVPYLLYPGISMLTFDDSVLAVARWFPQLTSASVPGVWSLCEHLPMEVALLCHQKGRAPWAGSPPAPPYPALWNPPVCSPASPSPVLPSPWTCTLLSFHQLPHLGLGSLFSLNSLPGSFLVSPSGSHPVPPSTWMHTQDRCRPAFLITARGHCPRHRDHTLNHCELFKGV